MEGMHGNYVHLNALHSAIIDHEVLRKSGLNFTNKLHQTLTKF